MAGASAAATAAQDYDVVTLSDGEHWSHSLADGETFENVLFDCTNANTRVSLTATGQNWTIRNVGIKGVHDQDGGHAVLGLKAANGTDCRVENVWMGDGSANYDGAGSSETAAWVSPKSTGTITFKHCYIQNWKDNGIYASAPGSDGNGAVVIDECYAANNNHADFRIGSTGSVVKNSAVEHTKSLSDCRGVWCWYNPGLEVRNVDINMNGEGASIHAGPYEPGEVDVYDTQYNGPLVEDGQGDGEIYLKSGNGTSPSVSVPDGVPLSAKEAASGSSSSTSSTTDWRALRVETPDGGDLVEYELVTSGEAVLGSEAESPDSVTQNSDGTYTITGIAGNGYADSYEFQGDLVDWTLSGGDATILVDGEVVNGGGTTTHSLRVETPDGGDTVDYALTTSGEAVLGSEAESPDSVTQNSDGTYTITGIAGNGYADSYEFQGEFLDGTLTGGDATVLVDGQTVLTNDSSSGPTIDRYDVTEAGSKNAAANIMAEWDVSDADGDLSDVTVEVLDSNASTVDSTSTSVSGDVAYGVDYFTIGGADGQTFDVTVTVTDSEGTTSTKTATVTE